MGIELAAGKGIYIWNTYSICGGDVKQIARTLKEAGFEVAYLHSSGYYNWHEKTRMALVPELRAVGIAVIGSIAVYGKDPVTEGTQAAKIVNDFDLDGMSFDAESDFDKVSHPDSAAVNLLKAYRANAKPGALAGWCWWMFYRTTAGNQIHPKEILWAAMDPKYGNADFGTPMAYWSWGNRPEDAVRYLDEVMKQWREVIPAGKPIIPAGRAYIGNEGTPTPAAITAFEKRARELGAIGMNWWSLEHALNKVALPGIWDALIDTPGFAHPQPPSPTPDPAPEEPENPEKPESAAGIRMKVIATGNLRLRRTAGSGEFIRWLTPGEKVVITDIAYVSGGAWGFVEKENGWACVGNGGGQFLQKIAA